MAVRPFASIDPYRGNGSNQNQPPRVNVTTRPSFATGSADNMERQINQRVNQGWRPTVTVSQRPSWATGSADNMERQIQGRINGGWTPGGRYWQNGLLYDADTNQMVGARVGGTWSRSGSSPVGQGTTVVDEANFAPDPNDVANEALTRAQVEAAWKNAIAQAAASEAAAQATYDETIRRMNQARPGQMLDLARLFSGRGLALSGARARATEDAVRQDIERRADMAAARDQQTVNANTIVADLAQRFAGQIDDAELQTLLRTIAAAAGFELA